MNEHEIQRHLKRAVNSLEPDNRAKKLWDTPVKKAKGNEWYLEGTKKSKINFSLLYKAMGVVAASIVLFISLSLGLTMRSSSMVYIDVNPSISMEVSYANKVVKAEALNGDGEKILDDMELKDIDVEVAANAILGSMLKNGYLDKKENAVLLSVESRSKKKADELSERLSDDIELCMEEMTGDNIVYYQSIDRRDKEIEKIEKQYGISRGKVALISKIKKDYPNVDIEKLSKLSIRELKPFLEENTIDIMQYIKVKTNISETIEVKKDSKDEKTNNSNAAKKQVDDTDDADDRDDADDADDGDDVDDTDNWDDADDTDSWDDADDQDDIDVQNNAGVSQTENTGNAASGNYNEGNSTYDNDDAYDYDDSYDDVYDNDNDYDDDNDGDYEADYEDSDDD